MTQAQLAAAIDVDAQTVARWERDERTPNAEDFGKVQRLQDNHAKQTGISTLVPRGTSEQTRRIEAFEREMLRLGADDFEADQVRALGLAFLGAVGANTAIVLIDEVELYLNSGLRPWVLKRIERRRTGDPQADQSDEPSWKRAAREHGGEIAEGSTEPPGSDAPPKAVGETPRRRKP